MVHVEVVRPQDLRAADLAAWSELQRSRPEWCNPFLSAAFTRVVALARRNVRVAVVRDARVPCGYFPFEVSRLGLARAVGMGLSDVHGPVLAPGLDLTFGELLRRCEISVWHATHMLSVAQEPGLLVSGLTRPAPWADLSEGFDAYCEGATAAQRRYFKGLRQRIRKIERELGPVRFELGSTLARPVLSQLMSWKSMQYRRTGHADPFQNPATVSIIAGAAASTDPDLEAVGSALYAGDDLLAVNLSLRCADTCAGWLSAYDREFARYAPGAIGMYLELEGCAAAGVTRFELGRGEESYKANLASRQDHLHDGYVRRATAVATVHRFLRAPVDAAVLTVLRSPRLRRGVRAGLATAGAVRASCTSSVRTLQQSR